MKIKMKYHFQIVKNVWKIIKKKNIQKVTHLNLSPDRSYIGFYSQIYSNKKSIYIHCFCCNSNNIPFLEIEHLQRTQNVTTNDRQVQHLSHSKRLSAWLKRLIFFMSTITFDWDRHRVVHHFQWIISENVHRLLSVDPLSSLNHNRMESIHQLNKSQ